MSSSGASRTVTRSREIGADTRQEAFEQWAPFEPGQDSAQQLMDEDIEAQCRHTDSTWEMMQLKPA